MKITFDADDLRPLIELAVSEALEQAENDRARLNGRLAYRESEAAGLIGVQPHVLRDARLRGRINASKCGRYILYQRSELLDFLRRSRLT